jgi:peroxiredoxin
MKIIKFILLGMCLPFGLKAQNGFVVHGTIGTGVVPGMAYLNYYDGKKLVLDSVILQKGLFKFNGKVMNPSTADLTVKHFISGKKAIADDGIRFYLENSDITVNTKDSLSKATVKGSMSYGEYLELQSLRKPYRKIADSVTRVYYSWTPEQKKDTVLIKSLSPAMKIAQAGYEKVSRAFMDSHLNSFISLQVFKELDLAYNFNPDTAEARFARFPASLRESNPGKKLASAIEIGKKTNIGVTATDFTQNDTTGKPVNLSDFRGKYVLVDFWASWCKPCRAENPNLLKAYNKYKDKNFTILGVSIDDPDGRKAWLRAVAQDGLPWTQVSELKGANSKAALAYGIENIPANFLISPEGKIVAKNLRGDELDKKLAEILKM